MADRITRYRIANPGAFFLSPLELESLQTYLRSRGILDPAGIVLSALKAGEGNMNCTLRVTTGDGTLVVKQARPWVEKYPAFDAPLGRAVQEAEFYRLISNFPDLSSCMPRLVDFDPTANLLVLEDLGNAGDYSDVYRGVVIKRSELEFAASFLSNLHRSFGQGSPASGHLNWEMRLLNHAHIFSIPLDRNLELNLDSITPGLAAAADELRAQADFCRAVAELGRDFYLSGGVCLIHGDFFPGSLLRTAVAPRIIDSEFAFFGRPEFDVGVFLAHLYLSNQPDGLDREWNQAYQPVPAFNRKLMFQFAGVEIMRRIIGYAQLPLICGLKRKLELLNLSRKLVLEPGP